MLAERQRKGQLKLHQSCQQAQRQRQIVQLMRRKKSMGGSATLSKSNGKCNNMRRMCCSHQKWQCNRNRVPMQCTLTGTGTYLHLCQMA